MRRLSEIEIALQRMAENARTRGDDISYTQRQENYEHIHMLDQVLALVEKVRATLLEERRRFVPVEQSRPPIAGNGPKQVPLQHSRTNPPEQKEV